MKHVPGRPDPPVTRLLEDLEDDAAIETLVLSTGSAPSAPALDGLLAEWSTKPHGRVLVLGTVGSHRDAHATRLRALWDLEEKARATGLPVLVLRLAPIVGPRAPLWLRLRSGSSLPGGGRKLLNPVVEADVIATLVRAFGGEAEWCGWFEVAGPEVLSLAELADLAGRDPELPRDAGAWEPALEEMEEQRLCDDRPWKSTFAITPRRVSAEARGWA